MQVRRLALLILALGAIAGCGDEPRGREGGSITIGISSQPDSLDPALAYTGEAWESLWLVYTPLLTYSHEEGTKGTRLIPGLAQELPQISDGGRTYKLTLRPNLTYSDGSPVRASDFENSVKRVLANRVRRHAVLHEHRRGRGLPEGGQARRGHQRHRGRRQDRPDHDQADGPRRDVLQLAGLDLRRPDPGEHPAEGPDQEAAAGRRPLRDHQVRARARVRAAQAGELLAAGHPQAQARADHRAGDRRPAPRDGAGDRQPAGLHDRPARARPAAHGAREARGPVHGAHHRLHLLLLSELEDPAVRQPQGARGREPGHRQPRGGAAVRRAAHAGLQLPAARPARATGRSSPARGARRTGPPTWPGRRSSSRRPAPRARR